MEGLGQGGGDPVGVDRVLVGEVEDGDDPDVGVAEELDDLLSVAGPMPSTRATPPWRCG